MIYVNARFLTQDLTGVQRFAIELSRELVKFLGDSVKFVSPCNVIQKKIAEEFHVEIVGKKTGYYWEQIELPRYLKKKGSPKLMSFCSVAPVFYSNNIVAIHDITWIRFPSTFSRSFRIMYHLLTPILCKKAKKILTVSHFSLKEICGYYGVPRNKIEVVYNAVDARFTNTDDPNLKKERYFVAVSSVKENKNFPVVVEAFKRMKEKKCSAKLYIIGDLKGKVFRNVDLSSLENDPDIKFLGRVSDDELIRYYSNAVAFIFPSLYEGFGIPVLEAQACGCPVISSNSSSLPEVLQDSAMLCEPQDVDEFARKMHLLLTREEERAIFVKRGYDNVSRFSWKNSARVILGLLIN